MPCVQWPGESLKSLGDATLRNFVKRLLLFFKPSSKQFSLIEAKREGSRQIVIVGCQFFEFLLEADEVRCFVSMRQLEPQDKLG